MSQILFVVAHELNEGAGGTNVFGLGNGMPHPVADKSVEPFAARGQRRTALLPKLHRPACVTKGDCGHGGLSTPMRMMCR
jgi:hypothetical protein